MKQADFLRNAVIVACFFLAFSLQVQSQVKTNIDWPVFLGQQDPIWEELPLQWNEGVFAGNGQIGMMIYATPSDNRIDFHLGRQDVTDHRKAPNRKSSMGAKEADVMFDYPRLDIGRMLLRPAGKIISGTMRQDLWNAEISGKIITDLGEISFKAYTLHDQMLNVIEISSSEKKDSSKVAFKWDFLPGNPASPRAQVLPERIGKEGYITNPNPIIRRKNDASVCVQPLLAGGDYATAWIEKTTEEASQSTLYVSTANEVPKSGVSEGAATQTVLDAAKSDPQDLIKPHRDWWHRFYQQSFLSIPDARMESFFWIQIYKMAVCSRPDGPAIDLFGPIFRVSQWPGLWWNLNVQLTYWPFYTSNHLNLSGNLIDLIDKQFESLLKSFRGPKLGDFGWVMHNYWLQYRYLGDWKSIQDKWVPKAMKIVAAYEELQHRNAKGKIELLPMGSPEYNGFAVFPNTNYNLAILHWLLNSLIESNEKFDAHQSEIVKWKLMLADLIPFPVDENGLKIGSNQSFDTGHRHYSHLLGLYPLFQLSPDNPGDRQLVEKSVIHWHNISKDGKLNGYSFTGAASLYAALGNGNKAEELLQQFLSGKDYKGDLLPNTMYVEGKGRNPVIETPLSAAASIMELLLQSWGNKIMVFPAVPDQWKDASFYQLRAQGGFLVSASRNNGKTRWISVKSLAGEPCIVKIPDWTMAVQISKGNRFTITSIADGEFKIDLKVGDEIILNQKDEKAEAVIKPIAHASELKNHYGVKKGQQMPEDQSWPLPEFKFE